MKTKILIYIFCSILISTFLFETNAQTYNMSNNLVTDCNGTIYDSGGASGVYGSNENATFQICPDDPDNSCVSLNFSFFNLEASFDFLYIYDGDATTGNLLGEYSATSPTTIISTNGCMTLVFDSDNGGNEDGWEATWTCIPPPVACGQEVCESTPPANDACPNATNIGSLPPPIPCFTGNTNQGNGSSITLNALTNLCATAEEPYNYIAGCSGAAAMASPAADVWYQMEVTGTSLDVLITDGMPNTSVGLWFDNGAGCGNLAAAGCMVGDGNNLQETFEPLNPGTYYLQISGGDEEEQCSFNLTLQNNYDCVACLTEQNFTVSPPPIDGVYEAGSTVEFCYTVSEYNQANTNFIHAVVPEFGAGWDISTLLPSSTPSTCGTSGGDWIWYEGIVTGSANGISAGTGFYFETIFPNNNPDPNNPGDNHGDGGVGVNGCSLTFCWLISAINSSNGESLSVVVETYSDSETGAWPNLSCQNDPSYTFNANLVNCFLPVADNIPNPVICQGDDVTITASGTADIVSYQWPAEAGGGTSPTVTLSPLTNTTYTLTVTNFCDEIDTETFTVEVINIDINATATTAFCDNSPTGSITVTPTNGEAPYSYEWSEASFGNTDNPTNVLPNTYTVTVTDDIGCTQTANVIVESDTDLAATATATNVLCFDTNTGTATANATNGGGGYTYLWNDAAAQITQTAIDLPAGDYIVTVTDANNCETTATVTVGNATEMTSTISATDAGCDGSTSGTIDLEVVGGTGNYTYVWDNGLPSQEDHTQNILGGIYNVTITDGNNCQITNSVEVTVPTPMQISIDATDAFCNGEATGTLSVNIIGGTPSLTYAWSGNLASQATHNNVSAGSYEVTVTDADGCSVVEDATVGEPDVLEIASLNAVDVICNGDASGSIELNVVGGTGNYTYTWNNGLGNDEDPQNVAMGNYAVTVTDGNNCEVQGTVSVGEPTALTIEIEETDVLCNGQNNGTITVTVSGGIGSYAYIWNNGITQTTAFVDNLDVGTYEVTVSDQNNCMITANATIDEPVFMLASINTEDASCEGQTDGSLNLNVSGGTGNYTYEWDNNLPPQQDHENVAAGDYSVLVTDENGCTVLGLGTVDAPEGLILETTTVDVSCNGEATGSIDLTVTGGESSYTYIWDNNLPAQQDHTISLTAGTYTVTVSDVNGCQNTTSAEIFESEAIDIILTATDISCNGLADGMIETTVAGGIFPYTFEWTNNLANQPIQNGLAAGTYIVTVTDANECQNTASVEIAEPNAMTSTIQTTDATCGQSDGSATVTPNGGATPYTYNWNTTPPQTSAIANNLSAGNYNVTITDASNCFIVETVNISDAGGPTATTSFNNPTCGNANGNATITVIGGLMPYIYVWDIAGESTATATNLAAGTYNVTVTDANNCAVSETFILTDDGVPSASISTTETFCNQDNGTATVTVNSGGTPDYTFLWDANANSQTTATVTNLAVGTYEVTISDINNCETIATATITAGQSTETTTSSTPASCGENNGSATITVNSGVPPFTYLWNANANGQTTSTANNLAAGDYDVTVTDGDFCETVETISVANTGAIPAITMSATNASCGENNGTATATVIEDFPPYEYEWNDANNQFSATAVDLAAGNYEVTVTDVNGCENTASVTVGNDGETTISIINIVPTTCGEDNGSAEVEINGTATSYDISWNDTNNQTTAIATDLAAGDYEVIVTDGNGCDNTATVTIATSEAIDATIDVTNSSCGTSNGTATINVISGAGNYTYQWAANANSQIDAEATNLAAGAYDFTITDGENCEFIGTANVNDEGAPTASISIDNEPTCGNANGSATVMASGGQGTLDILWDANANSQTTATASNLAAGNYTVTITDQNDCVVTENVTLTDAGLPTATATTTAATCGLENGEATITATNGGGNYSYLWNDANAQSTATATNLAAGTYEPTITDSNNCSITIEVIIEDVPNVTLNISVTDANCGQPNGSATITPVGGTPPLEFLWNDDAAQTTEMATNLLAGSYTVTITDADNCEVEATVTINDIGGPTTSISATEATCGQENGTATVTITGASGTVTYLWDDVNAQNTPTATDLPAGLVSCTITDGNGCTSTQTIEVPSSDSPVLDISATTADCGQDDGTATVTVISGGQEPFTYLWNDDATNGQETATATDLAEGNYTVTVTDATFCAVTAEIEVTSTEALQIDISATQDFCGQALATATATPTNGQAPYTYLWNDDATSGQVTPTATALVANNYTVTVTDNNGCEATASVEVTEIAAPTASITNTTDASCNQTDGTATVEASGGGTNYTYLWDLAANEQNTATATDLGAGTYSVTVTDENNCFAEATAIISNVDAPTISISSTDTDCGVANGTATITASGGVEPYTYLWSNDSTTAVIDSLLPATYTVTLTDNNGCDAVESVTINGNIATPSPICFEQTSNSITVVWESISGAVGYEVEINGNTQTVVDTFFVVENLAQEETVTLNILADGGQACGLSATATVSCTTTAENCPPADATFDNLDLVYCVEDATFELAATPAGGIFSIDGIANTSFNPQEIGSGQHEVTYTFTDENNCLFTASQTVEISAVTASISPATITIAPSNATTLSVNANSALGNTIQYSWGDETSLDCTDCETVTAMPSESTTYTVLVSDEYGCVDNATAIVSVVANNTVAIPTAFTPNGDGQNDEFKVIGTNISEVELSVYNRWGNKLFTTNDISQAWNGQKDDRDADIGVYVYYAKIVFTDKSEEFFKGNVTLIR